MFMQRYRDKKIRDYIRSVILCKNKTLFMYKIRPKTLLVSPPFKK